MLSFESALESLLTQAQPIAEVEVVALVDGLNRVLAQPTLAPISVPAFDNSAMDGYAVRAEEIKQGESLPISQRIAAGYSPQPLQSGTVARIFTGAAIPEGANAVVMQEQCEAQESQVSIQVEVKPGQHIRRIGEDIRAGSEILSAGCKLKPPLSGLAASVGIAELSVYRHLRVGVFFTGDELVTPGNPLTAGKIYNSNRYLISSLLSSLHCQVTDFGTIADNLAATRQVLRKAAESCDVIISSGGVSVGEEDHVKAAIEQEGELTLWKIAIKPGKPLAFGRVGQAAFIGLPGNPISGFVTFLMLVRPFLLKCQGLTEFEPPSYSLTAGFDWPKPDKRREFLRARFNGESVEIYPQQGSGVLTSAAWSNGLADIPPDQAVKRGDRVRFIPFAELFA